MTFFQAVLSLVRHRKTRFRLSSLGRPPPVCVGPGRPASVECVERGEFNTRECLDWSTDEALVSLVYASARAGKGNAISPNVSNPFSSESHQWGTWLSVKRWQALRFFHAANVFFDMSSFLSWNAWCPFGALSEAVLASLIVVWFPHWNYTVP